MNEFKFSEMSGWTTQNMTPDYIGVPACSTKWIMPRGGDCSGHGLRSHIWARVMNVFAQGEQSELCYRLNSGKKHFSLMDGPLLDACKLG